MTQLAANAQLFEMCQFDPQADIDRPPLPRVYE
jgi:hypothetical protein